MGAIDAGLVHADPATSSDIAISAIKVAFRDISLPRRFRFAFLPNVVRGLPVFTVVPSKA